MGVYLKKEGFTKNVQVVRHWLRSGKLKGLRASRKEGWRIQENDLKQFIDTRHGNVTEQVTKEDIKVSYQNGYEKGRKDMIHHLLARVFYEQCVTVRKTVLRYYVERDVRSKEQQKKILEHIFKRRSNVSIHVLDNYVLLPDTGELVTYDDEDHIAGIIAEVTRKKLFINTF